MIGAQGKGRIIGVVAVLAGCLLGGGCDKPEQDTAAVSLPEEALVEVDMTPEPMLIESAATESIIDKTSKVTILGYHQFITRGNETEMRISVSKFREQMRTLHEAGIPVISLADYMAWRRGKKQIPRQCVIITVDDGFSGLFSEALTILREFGYPFTFYLYTNFLGGGGRTLADDEVRALIAAGGELGSHSISHDFLVGARKKFARQEQYEEWLLAELKGSKDKLEARFGVKVRSFAYPYGEYSKELARKVAESGYTSAVTVNGAKAGYGMSLMELPRYIIHGNNDLNWRAATSFNGISGIAEGANLLNPVNKGQGEKPRSRVKVWPENKSEIVDRMPTIWADISQLGEIDPDSLMMKVSGFGSVPVNYYPKRGVVLWDVTRALRTRECLVSLSLRRAGEKKTQFVTWSFRINRNAYYLPGYREKVAAQAADAAANAGGEGEGEARRALHVP
ncbi:MAG: polysaccharide deacetylase family protein [Verrucomicrobiales bacterium]